MQSPLDRLPYCSHSKAVPVESAVNGDVVAALCPACDASLPAAWLTCAHQTTVDMSCLGERRGRTLCNGCGVTYWDVEWAVGDRVTVYPITARVDDGPQSGYLVVRDPDGDARISAVEYGDEPKPEPEFVITSYSEGE